MTSANAAFVLQVLENLQLAAKLRLPISGSSTSSHGLCCGSDHHQRHRDVHKVVGEVMALMALTKVATTVGCVWLGQILWLTYFFDCSCFWCSYVYVQPLDCSGNDKD